MGLQQEDICFLELQIPIVWEGSKEENQVLGKGWNTEKWT